MPPWCRLYSEVLDDRKLKRITALTRHPRALILGCWATLLARANQGNPRGTLSIGDNLPITQQEIAEEFGLDLAETGRILEYMVELDMLRVDDRGMYSLPHFQERNYASDDSSSRVKQHRQKEKAVTVTAEDRYSNAPEQSRTEQSKTEQRQSRADDDPPAAAAVFQSYERELGHTIAESVGQDIIDLLDGGTPPQWFPDAFAECARHNKRNWAYARKILERWRAEGKTSAPTVSGESPSVAAAKKRAAELRKGATHATT